MRVAVLAIVSACIPAGAVSCPDGKLCADGTTCVEVSNPDTDVCATPDQLVACNGKSDHARCGDDGRCYSGVCLPIVCGNGRLDSPDPNTPGDTGEVCDDGNQISNDGCSADCLSDETCGNGVPDLVKGELCDDGNLIQHDGCDSTCKPEAPRWVQLPSGGPSVRSNFAMAYDSDRERVVLFGGADAVGNALGDTWEWNGAGWIQMAPPASPSPRSGCAMAYDPNLKRAVLFGGGGVDVDGDTWAWDGATWTPLDPATSPQPRVAHVMFFDGTHVSLIDGIGPAGDGFHLFQQTWTWDGKTWTLSPVEPPINAAAAAFDPIRGRTVMFDGNGVTWESDGATWTNAATTGPPARDSSAMAFDPVTRSIMMFGGRTTATSSPITDHWQWTGTEWVNIAATLPAARFGHAMVAVPERGRLVMFGGTVDDPSTWEWDGSQWLETPPFVPDPPQAMAFAYDSLRGITVLFAQLTGAVETLRFDGTSWLVEVFKQPQVSLDGVAMTFDELRGVSVMVTDGETFTYDATSAWKPVGSAPSRIGAEMAFDGTHSILFGGMNNGDDVSDTFAWDGQSWSQLAPAHHPPGRELAAIARDPIRGEAVLFGGLAGSDMLGDTWVWDGADWTERTPATAPSPRTGAKLAWNPSRRRLELFGGFAGRALDDVWEWDGTTWTRIAVFNAPPARHDHAWFPALNGLVAFGGRPSTIGGSGFADTWLLRWDGAHADESCQVDADDDGDGLRGCADPDCWTRCAPECSPGTSCTAGPRCGDGHCDAVEDCRSCPADCACTPICGDFTCDPGEDHESCPGDCL
jgi:cysteine-rich repeat protein